MKKLIFVNAFIMLALTAVCQSKDKFASPNLHKEMMINGIPYSQYKAQQEALKKQEVKDKQAIAKKQQELSLDLKDAVQTAPVTQQAVPALNKKIEAAPVVVPPPATQMIPAGSLNDKVVPQQPVPVSTSVATKTEAVSKANPTAVAIPVISLSTASDANAAALTAPVNNAVKVELSKTAPVPTEEIKPSVTPAAPKSPAMNMQSAEKPKG